MFLLLKFKYLYPEHVCCLTPMALSDLPTSERMKRRVVSTGDLEKLERDEADRYTSFLLKT